LSAQRDTDTTPLEDAIMLFDEYDLHVVQHRFAELRREAQNARLADAVRAASTRRSGFGAGLRSLASLLHLTHGAGRSVEAAA
jgi:hypothetical protein